MIAPASSRVARALVVAVCLMAAAPARAHAPPYATGIRWIGEPVATQVVVRTNRGLIVGDAASRAFRLVCNDAFRAALVEVVPTAELPDGGLLVGTYAAGLLRSDPAFCNFEPVGPEAISPIDVKSDLEGNVRALLLPLDGSDGSLFESNDGAASFRALSPVGTAPTAHVSAPSNSQRVYVSTNTTSGNTSTGHVLSSDDGGKQFTDRVLELDGSELRAFVLAVDPENSESVFVRTQSRDGVTPERLLRSQDGGQTFQTVLRAEGPLTVAFGGRGTVWAGSATGLYRSRDSGATFDPSTDNGLVRIGCLAVRAGELYACALNGLEFGVLVSKDEGTTFDWFLRFSQVTARAECSPTSDEGARCAAAFEDWSLEQLVPAGGGGSSGGGEPPSRETARDESAGGCRMGKPGGRASGLWYLALLGLARYRRRARAAHG
jgi:hypothetical protein